jgi:exodeoxyribonuclease VII small subunit
MSETPSLPPLADADAPALTTAAAPGRPNARAAKAAPAAALNDDVAGLSFEAALAELDGIVKKLEGGQAKLEEAIADYERGAALRRHCEAKLAEAEQKVQAIVAHGASASLRDMA